MAVIRVKEPPSLGAVQGVIGGIEVEPDLLRPRSMGVQGEGDHQRVHPDTVGGDLLVARLAAGFRWGQLQAVERARGGLRPCPDPARESACRRWERACPPRLSTRCPDAGGHGR